MKYALLGWNDKQAKRGAYTEAKQLEQRYPSNVTAFNTNSAIDIGRIKDEFDKIVYTYQQPNQYLANTLFDIKRYNLDIQYIRKEYFSIFKHKTTNGFSTYIENKFYNNFVPMMIPMYQSMPQMYDKISIGYYLRPIYKADCLVRFKNFIKNLNIDVDLWIIGTAQHCFKQLSKHIINEYHTFDRDAFFSNITHYIYSKSKTYDPWPTTLQEAVNANKQIIIFENDRNFKDGVDDICENIKYHTKLDIDTYYDNINSIINNWNFDTFYKMVFENGFLHEIDRNKYKHIYDWLVSLE